MSSVVNSALSSGSGGVVGQITGINKSITSMDQQIVTLQKQATEEIQELTKQFAQAQATMNQLSSVSSFLTAYFNQTSGAGGD